MSKNIKMGKHVGKAKIFQNSSEQLAIVPEVVPVF